MSSVAPERHEAGPGLWLRLPLPDGARETPRERLPGVDLSAIAGARVTLLRGIEATDGLSLRAVCVAAPSSQWAPGIEELVLDRASGLVRGSVGALVDRWEAAPIAQVATHFEQSFEGAGRAGDQAVALRGRHVLGFAGDEHAAVLCSVVCLKPGQPDGRCETLVDAAQVEGVFLSAPEPSWLIQGILAAAAQPYLAAAGICLLAAASVALLLSLRPRPRP